MNKERRKKLASANELLDEIRDKLGEVQDIVDECKSEEEDYRDNMPENMQNSDKYYAADSAVEEMESARIFLSFSLLMRPVSSGSLPRAMALEI